MRKFRVIVLILGLMTVFMLPVVANAAAGLVKPLLCEHECGGAWGAYEHAKHDSEALLEEYSTVKQCANTGKNQKGVTQWVCEGTTTHCRWLLGLDPYGYLVGEIGYNCKF